MCILIASFQSIKYPILSYVMASRSVNRNCPPLVPDYCLPLVSCLVYTDMYLSDREKDYSEIVNESTLESCDMHDTRSMSDDSNDGDRGFVAYQQVRRVRIKTSFQITHGVFLATSHLI